MPNSTDALIDIFHRYACLVAEVRFQETMIENLTKRLNELLPPPAKDGKPQGSAGLTGTGHTPADVPHSIV